MSGVGRTDTSTLPEAKSVNVVSTSEAPSCETFESKRMGRSAFAPAAMSLVATDGSAFAPM